MLAYVTTIYDTFIYNFADSFAFSKWYTSLAPATILQQYCISKQLLNTESCLSHSFHYKCNFEKTAFKTS